MKKVQLPSFIKNVSRKTTIWLLLLSILISCCFFTDVNEFVDKVLPSKDLAITICGKGEMSNGSDVVIYLVDGLPITSEKYNECTINGNWMLGNWGSTPVIYGNQIGDSIIIPVHDSASGGVTIWCQDSSGIIDIEAEGKIARYDLFDDSGTDMQIMPFEDSMVSVVVYAVIYIVLTVSVALVLLLALKLFDSCQKSLGRLSRIKYEYKYVVLVLFIMTYIFDIIWYQNGILNFNAFGDQPSYWAIGGSFAEPGITKERFLEIANAIPCFRGYGMYLPSFIAQFISNRLNVEDPYIVYFALPSLTSAFLFGYVLPKLYEILHNDKVNIAQIALADILFFIFYKGNLVSIDGDLFGLAFYIAGALFVLLLLMEGKLQYAVFGGLFLSLCLAIRTSYLIGFIILIVSIALIVFISYKKKTENKFKALYAVPIKKWVLLSISFVACFILVCVPQMEINAQKGHPGLFAYDQDGAYGSSSTTLLEDGVDHALRGELTGYPSCLMDKQIQYIRYSAGYGDEQDITMAQGLDAYASSPLDTLVSIAKRFFAFLDIKSNMTLPDIAWMPDTWHYLFSTLNYLLIAVTLFCIVKAKVRKMVFSSDDLLIWGILILGPVAPMMATRIEWRQAMIEYIFYLSYVFPFCFIKVFADKEKRKAMVEENILPFITTCVFLFHAVSLTMYH